MDNSQKIWRNSQVSGAIGFLELFFSDLQIGGANLARFSNEWRSFLTADNSGEPELVND